MKSLPEIKDIKKLKKYAKNEKMLYKKYRDKYIPDHKEFSIKEMNWIDRVLFPFRSLLQKVALNQEKIVITDDITTSYETDNIGKRVPYGFFEDTAGGAARENAFIVIPKSNFTFPLSRGFVLAHEWAHQIHFKLPKDKQKEIINLYKSALERHTCLDEYAASNEYDYFAQGFDAYFSNYKPHKLLINSSNYLDLYSHTKSKLKKLDRPLYDFIDNLVKEYNQVSLCDESKESLKC
jgi:hypothetical protein